MLYTEDSEEKSEGQAPSLPKDILKIQKRQSSSEKGKRTSTEGLKKNKELITTAEFQQDKSKKESNKELLASILRSERSKSSSR